MLVGDLREGARRTVPDVPVLARRELNVGTRFCMM
jgi:hypothetical protein